MSLKMIIPPEGIKQNSTFDFEGEFEKVGQTSSKRIVVDVKTTYKDNKEYDDIIAPNIEATFDNNKFKGTCKKFWFNDFFLKDSEKSTDATFNLQLIAKGKTVVNEFVSEIYTFPMVTKTVILKLGHYDDNGVKNYPDRCKKGDANYIEGDAVLKLQQNLIRFRLLNKGAADGDFGEKTHKAVSAFQDYAKKFERIKMKEGLVLKVDRITFTGDIDGIVGDKTQKEIDLWYQQEYVRPVPTLYHKDYDENWVKNGKGKKGTEEFHQSTPVTDLQKNLKKVGVFQNGKDDGHFFDRTKAELIRFQEAAAKGEFVNAINEIITLTEKLTDFIKGVACPNTSDYISMLIEKNFKVKNEQGKELLIKDVLLPNGNISFTTKEGENHIIVSAEINSSDIPNDLENEICWECEDDPEDPCKYTLPVTKHLKGSKIKIIVDLKKEENGRNWKKIKFRVRAILNYKDVNYSSEWKIICQDEIDMLRQQYIDMSKDKIPERVEFICQSKSVHFKLAEGACSCGNHSYQLWSIMDRLDEVRTLLGKPMSINSGYRCPQKNKNTPGSAKESQHLYGFAADIGVDDFNDDGKADVMDWEILKTKANSSNASYIEPYAKTGTWVHMDWRKL